MGMKFSDELYDNTDYDNIYNNETLNWLNGNGDQESNFNVNIEEENTNIVSGEFDQMSINEVNFNQDCNEERHCHDKDDDHKERQCHDKDDDHKEKHCHPDKGRGRIIFTSRLQSENGEPISGVKVFLFKIENLKFRLISISITNRQGRVVFDGLRNGIYKVVQPMDKCFFRDPIYLPSDQVPIDDIHHEFEITAVNRLRIRNVRCNNNCGCRDFDNGCEGLFILLFLFAFCGCGFFWF